MNIEIEDETYPTAGEATEETVRMIPLTDIRPHRGNRAEGKTDKAAIRDLAKSILGTGLQQPIIVRPSKGKAEYEIVCGERRYRAFKLLKLITIAALVRDYDDAHADHARLVENLQRQDVHPLDEANAFDALLDAGESAKDIAAKVGRSQSYVYSRRQLVKLIDPAKVKLRGGTMEVGPALVIAKLLPNDQKRILTQWYYRWNTGDAENWVKKNIFHALDQVAFDTTDAELKPKAGACTACPKRTGYEPALFEGLAEDDHCLDPQCFKRKTKAHLERVIEKIGDKPFIKIMGDSYAMRAEGIESTYDYEPALKKDESAVLAVTATGPKTGEKRWMKPRTPGGQFGPVERTPEEEEKIFQSRLDTETRHQLVDATMEAIAASMKFDSGGLAPSALRFLATEEVIGNAYAFGFDYETDDDDSVVEAVAKWTTDECWGAIVKVALQDIIHNARWNEVPRLTEICKFYGIDREKMSEGIRKKTEKKMRKAQSE